MIRRTFRLLVLASVIAPVVAAAENGKDVPAAIRKTMESRFPGIAVVDVAPSPLPGLYEVFTGDAIVYTDSTGDHMLAGPLVDTATRRDLTADRMTERNAIDFGSLPFEHAIKVVKGNGERKLAVFADPDCPFCRKLEAELQNLDDVTLYTFLLPIQELHPEAVTRSHTIWCSQDRAKAWSQWLLERRVADENASCDSDPVQELQALGRKLHITGTPTMFLVNGRRVSGAMTTGELNQLLNQPTQVEGQSPRTARKAN